ncbi:DMT superfamily drug/metabolite transporter [Desmospora sp. 8437]|nr:DMT superfamily drug/metabolite transporter [Desmospora sp. 8437]
MWLLISQTRPSIPETAKDVKKMHWVYLIFAILFEVAGTMSMKLSHGFTKLWPSLGMVVFYILAFAGLTLSLKQMPVSLAYAVWSGLGTAVIAVLGYLIFQESMTWLKASSILLIVLGVIGLNLGEGSDASDSPEPDRHPVETVDAE